MVKLKLKLLISSFIGLFSCFHHSDKKLEAGSETNAHFGRLQFYLPDQFALKQAVYMLDYVQVKLLDSAITNLDSCWQQHLQYIHSLKQSREIDTDRQGEIVTLKAVSPALKTVIYYGDSNTELITCSALKATSLGILQLQIEGDRDRQQIWYQRLLSLAQAFDTLNKTSTSDFYLHRGRFVLPPGYQMEEINVRFIDTASGTTLHIRTNSFSKEKEKDRMENSTSPFAQGMASLTTGVTTVRDQQRTVAGVEGRELIFQFNQMTKEKLFFGFHAEGQAGSVKQPEMDIEMEATGFEKNKKIQLWESLLGSMKIR